MSWAWKELYNLDLRASYITCSRINASSTLRPEGRRTAFDRNIVDWEVAWEYVSKYPFPSQSKTISRIGVSDLFWKEPWNSKMQCAIRIPSGQPQTWSHKKRKKIWEFFLNLLIFTIWHLTNITKSVLQNNASEKWKFVRVQQIKEITWQCMANPIYNNKSWIDRQ